MDIQQALNLFGLSFTVSNIQDTGVSVDYQLIPTAANATINRLKTRLDDIQAVTGERISVVLDNGLWLRTDKPQKKIFNYKDYCGYVTKKYGVFELPYMVGLTSTECIVDDLAKAPHLLVAGTTGSGKSNYLHTLINAMLCNTHCCVDMIDCKKVEFTVYSKPCNVYTDVDGAYYITAAYLRMMDARYEAMQKEGYTDFKEYRKKHPDECYRVLVVDELADLLMNKEDKKELSWRFQKIAQIGRAAGFHMVLATQRPDCKTIDGVLKANIPTRISFNVSSRVDSQVIIDRTGAERLTGNGDGLYLDKKSNLTRFQACYFSMDDIKDGLRKDGLL
jgi:S-DNA-T family DNA segregation ATPase FtsK/SpoIIIE